MQRQGDMERTQQSVDGLPPELDRVLAEAGFGSLCARDGNGECVLHYMLKWAQKGRKVTNEILLAIERMPPDLIRRPALTGQLAGYAPLHLACNGRDPEDRGHEVIRALVNGNADMEMRDRNGRTALHVTAGSAYRNGACMLQELGADMCATGANGRNFADMCNGNDLLVRWWEEVTGWQATGRPAERREGMYRRTGCSEKRYERFMDGKARGKLGRGKGKGRGKRGGD